MANCPLCGSCANDLGQDSRRHYYVCPSCWLAFADCAHHLSAEQEKAVYDLHENSLEDEGYKRFLNRLCEPMLQRIAPDAKGLDFGCGPGPALAAMFEAAGRKVDLFDKFYFPDLNYQSKRYDFITATEVVEHLDKPLLYLQQLWTCLQPGGHLGVMTKRWRDRDSFFAWHYINDPTHIVFFHERTFDYLAEYWGAKVEFTGADTAIFTKPVDSIVS